MEQPDLSAFKRMNQKIDLLVLEINFIRNSDYSIIFNKHIVYKRIG